MLDGAVYRPLVDNVPTAGLTPQVTAVFVLPVTPAVNCWVCEFERLIEAGLMVTATGGTRVTVALEDLVASAALVAVIVTVWVALMLDGAVYRPLVDSVPTDGLMLQVTAVFVLPVTPAVNCWVWEPDRLIEAGLAVTATGGRRVTVALADLVASAALVAVIVTVWVALMLDGAV
jgi:hypothetical protein